MERRAVIILGPTASGKSFVSIKLAEILATEIISADSRQFYKYLNIGTAKVSPKERYRIRHHFIDSLEPTDYYNASKFETDVSSIIDSLNEAGRIPVITGGSGLYIQALVDGILEEVEIDEAYRNELIRLREKQGNEYIYKILERTDPKSASTMLPQNWKRVIRALEVYKLSGKSIVDLHKQQRKNSAINFLQFGIEWPRDILYERINKRVDEMIEQGLIDETKGILQDGYEPSLNSLNTVGYKEIISCLQNEINLDRAIELIKRNTRRYAKRQLTWFRKDDRIEWIPVNTDSDLEPVAEIIYNKISIIQ